ncbi:hypothetical protein [Robbsia andropogonis]|uniref:hypothetical protein n=1 Tax=Robbsia andropogonis TaxID=28092 RepID=UPI002A6B7EA1|nr:hypothetical protein [Robbsia andropogonis]
MTTVTDVVFGAASDGSQGDTVRIGFTKVNQNIQALNTGKADISGADFTGDVSTEGAFTATKKVTASGGLNVTGEASFAQRPTYAGKTAYDTGNLDLTPYAKLSGASFAGDVSTTGKLSAATLAVAGTATFTQRPIYAGYSPWDGGNLKTPVDAGSDATIQAGRTALAQGRTLLSSQTFAVGSGVSAVGFDLSSTEFDDYEIEFSGVQSDVSNQGLLVQFGISGQSGYDSSSSYTSLYRYMSQPSASGVVSDNGQCFLANPYFLFMTIYSIASGTSVSKASSGDGSIILRNMKATSLFKKISFEYNQVTDGGSLVSGQGHGFYFGSTGAISKIQLYLNGTGVKMTGRFSLYGIKR